MKKLTDVQPTEQTYGHYDDQISHSARETERLKNEVTERLLATDREERLPTKRTNHA